MKMWKKNLVAAAILVTVCAGIYLNWTYSNNQATSNFTDTLDAEKVMSNQLVLDDALAAAAQENLSADSVTDYFAAVRLSRQEARDSAVNVLQEAISADNGEEANASSNKLDSLVQTALSEAQIESLVIAKGYTDCVAYMNDKGISVAVASPEGGLKNTDVAVIADIVMSQSGYDLNEIRVVEVQ